MNRICYTGSFSYTPTYDNNKDAIFTLQPLTIIMLIINTTYVPKGSVIAYARHGFLLKKYCKAQTPAKFRCTACSTKSYRLRKDLLGVCVYYVN